MRLFWRLFIVDIDVAVLYPHGPDRLWSTHFYPKVTGNAKLRNQDIETKIQAMYRHKDKDGEWLTYHVTLYGNDWEGNRISFHYTECKIEGFPIFHRRVDPQTDEIVPGSTTILELGYNKGNSVTTNGNVMSVFQSFFLFRRKYALS